MPDSNGSDRPDGEPGFTVALYHTKYLPRQARELHAVVSVTVHGLTGHLSRGSRPQAAEVILVDTSGSMESPPEKMRAARKATVEAIAAILDGVSFAVVGGNNQAKMIYPNQPTLVKASARTRKAANRAVGTLTGSGGTAIGSWLLLANQLFEDRTSGVRHALLFTDGQNQHETRAELDRVLAKCNGRFVCDARGIGADWQESELHRIVSVLNGRSDAVRAYADMEEDFRELMRAAMSLAVPDVSLRIATRAGAWLRSVRQVYPTVADVAGRQAADAGNAADYYTGSWADERRDYQLTFEVDSTGRPTETDTLAATVELVIGRPAGGPSTEDAPTAGITLPAEPELILLQWTSDPLRYTEFDDVVAHYTGQQDLGEAVRAGCDAIRRHDDQAAVGQLGRAVALAFASGNQEALDRLAALVEIVNPTAGEVQLRRDTELTDLLWTEAGSRGSVRWPGEPSPHSSSPSPPAGGDGSTPGAAAVAERTCARCELKWPGSHRHCEKCGGSLDNERAMS